MGVIHRSCTIVRLLSMLRVQLSLQRNLKMKRDSGELASCTVVSQQRTAGWCCFVPGCYRQRSAPDLCCQQALVRLACVAVFVPPNDLPLPAVLLACGTVR